jgi:imidazolonepropionase-like amidohydrolase
MRRCLLGVVSALAAASALAAQMTPGAPKPAAAYVIRNATIVPVTGPRITNGNVVMQGGKIVAVGASAAAPAGATVIDGTGLFVYPGLINSGTYIGLDEIGSVPGGNDRTELGEFNPHDVALSAVNPHSELIPVARYNGLTSAITAPTGGLISGQASLIDLSGWTGDEMAVKRSAGMVVNYPRSGGRGGRGGGGGRGGAQPAEDMNETLRHLREYFANARAYSDVKAKLASGAPGMQKTDLAMEAMVPVMRGESPVIFEAETVAQIRGALAFADSFKLKPIIRGAHEAWQLADTLAARKVPVIVGPIYAAPDPEAPYDEIYANPGVLAKAGVIVAFQTGGASSIRDLPFEVALTVGFGLDADDAIKSITINPARIWGVADRLGSIETGKVANLFVTTGDPLDPRSHVRYLFIRGEQVPLVDRHTKLYEEFRARPKPSKP